MTLPGESAEIQAWRAMPPDAELVPGVTVGELLAYCAIPPLPEGVTLRTETYRELDGVELRMLIWIPAPASVPRPGVVFIHGGSWVGGDPVFHARHCSELAALGFVAATIQYRLSTAAPWPAALEDARAAVAWVRSRHHELGLDPQRLAVSGGSAGGHLAALLAVTAGRQDTGTGDSGEAVQGAILWYPVTDMRAAHPDLDPAVALFLTGSMEGRLEDVSDLLDLSSPVRHIAPGCPPVLTLTGDADLLCPAPMIRDFHRRLDQDRVPNQLVVYPGAGHGWDMSLKTYRPGFDLAVEFLRRHLGAGSDLG